MKGTDGGADFADVVVHVGYHKTGSSLLQARLFTEDNGLYSPWTASFYHRNILLDRPDRRWADRIRTAFVPGIAEARRRGLTPVLSCEALSGDMWRVGQANGYGNFHVADALGEAFPGARVALVHRAQATMVTSLYKHSLRSHWRYDLDSFLDQSPISQGMAPVLNLGYLEYSHLLAHYQDLVGQDRVLALPFELLRQPAAWADAWEGFLGVEIDPGSFDRPENPGFAAVTVQGKRVLNYAIAAGPDPNRTRRGKVINSIAAQIDSRVPDSVRARSDRGLRDDVARRIGDRFVADNTRLATLTGRDWSSFGYRVEPSR